MPQYYEIKIKGHLDPHWAEWFASLSLTHLDGEETMTTVTSGSHPLTLPGTTDKWMGIFFLPPARSYPG